jgi:hypothetical protein
VLPVNFVRRLNTPLSLVDSSMNDCGEPSPS